jgi:hypothetical protein
MNFNLNKKEEDSSCMQQEATNDQRDKEKEADYTRETDVAEIRAMGGMQTDVNANGEPDALEGVETMY